MHAGGGPMDDVLRSLRVESTSFVRAELSAPWGLWKDRFHGSSFHVVQQGGGWLRVGERRPLRLQTGDLVIVPHGDPYELMDEPGRALTSMKDLIVAAKERVAKRRDQADGVAPGVVRIAHGGGGARTSLLSGAFFFLDRDRNPLVRALPPLLHVPAAAPEARPWLATTLGFLAAEVDSKQPGAHAVAMRLAEVLFVQAVRAHLLRLPRNARGWLRVLADERLAPAFAAMHLEPGKAWTVQGLAERAALSRSAFSARFTELMGAAPLAYLTEWRMARAMELLAGQDDGVERVALAVGYESAPAFTKAFKRWAGVTPGAYRRRERGLRPSGARTTRA